jgi:hypothetical protein
MGTLTLAALIAGGIDLAIEVVRAIGKRKKKRQEQQQPPPSPEA